MNTTISLDDRRHTLGRLVLALTNKRGPLTAAEATSLRNLHSEMNGLESDIQADANRKRGAAFRSWLRNGLTRTEFSPGITTEERAILENRDMGGGAAFPGSLAGYFIPAEFYDRVESAMKYYGPMLDLATVQDTISGAARGFPTDDDRAVTGEQVDENIQATEMDIQNLNQTILKSYKYGSKVVKVSAQLAQDAGFDLEGYLADRFGIRMGRILNSKFTNGSGTNEPYGVSVQATLGATANGSASNDGTSASTNTIGSDDLAALEASVDVAFRPNSHFLVHPNTLAALRQVLSKTGAPLFPGLHNAGEDTIFGYSVAVNPAMDQLPTTPSSPPVIKKTVLFGDFAKYVVRRVRPIMVRLEERWGEYGQIGYILWQRFDGALIDGGGGSVKYLSNAY